MGQLLLLGSIVVVGNHTVLLLIAGNHTAQVQGIERVVLAVLVAEGWNCRWL